MKSSAWKLLHQVCRTSEGFWLYLFLQFLSMSGWEQSMFTTSGQPNLHAKWRGVSNPYKTQHTAFSWLSLDSYIDSALHIICHISKKDVQNIGIKMLAFKISSLSNSEAALNVLSTQKAIPQCIVKFLIQEGNLDFFLYLKIFYSETINACRNKFYTIFLCLEYVHVITR